MKLLLAVDGSEPSNAAVDEVSRRLWPAGTTVRVLSAVQPVVPPASTLWYDAGGSLDRLHGELTKHAEDVTQRAAALLQAKGVATEPVVCEGDPRSVILDDAEAWGADLIVVGSHGYTGLQRFFLGSVALFVVSHAPCSVEVVRRKKRGEIQAEETAAHEAGADEAGAELVPLPPA